MARGIKLTDSVSISELMHMREVEGLSNGEIARRLGVHINTICKAIGPHPDGKRAKHKRPTRTAEKLPALPEKQIPDMPRESFKERCERLMARVEESPAPIATLMTSMSARAEDAVSAANQPKMHYNYLTRPRKAGETMRTKRRTSQQRTGCVRRSHRRLPLLIPVKPRTPAAQ